MKFKEEVPGRGGWCDWIMPIPKGYHLKCCGCGLVHEVQFKAFAETNQKRNGAFTVVELPWPIRAMFRMRLARKQ